MEVATTARWAAVNQLESTNGEEFGLSLDLYLPVGDAAVAFACGIDRLLRRFGFLHASTQNTYCVKEEPRQALPVNSLVDDVRRRFGVSERVDQL